MTQIGGQADAHLADRAAAVALQEVEEQQVEVPRGHQGRVLGRLGRRENARETSGQLQLLLALTVGEEAEAEAERQALKWSLTALVAYLESAGIDAAPVFAKIQDLIIRVRPLPTLTAGCCSALI